MSEWRSEWGFGPARPAFLGTPGIPLRSAPLFCAPGRSRSPRGALGDRCLGPGARGSGCGRRGGGEGRGERGRAGPAGLRAAGPPCSSSGVFVNRSHLHSARSIHKTIIKRPPARHLGRRGERPGGTSRRGRAASASAAACLQGPATPRPKGPASHAPARRTRGRRHLATSARPPARPPAAC